jgi:hypothetical protein
MPALLLVVSLFITTGQEAISATADEKKRFLNLLAELPHAGEFYTDESVTKAAPYTRVLLSLTDEDLRRFVAEREKIDAKDVKDPDLYPFLALSRGLLDREGPREYGVKHFGEIAHPVIRLAWAVMLFNEKAASPEIVKYLRSALESKERSKVLTQMLGPDFEDFKRRVKEHPLKKK